MSSKAHLYVLSKSHLSAIDISASATECENSRKKVLADHPVSHDTREVPNFPNVITVIL